MKCKPILVVEHDELNIESIRKAFSEVGARNPLIFRHSGKEALDCLLQPGGEDGMSSPAHKPCLILLALNLPDISGLDLIRELRANLATRRIPIVALSSMASAEDILTAYRHGANSYIRKSLPPERFNEDIRTLCDYWLTIARLPVA